MVLLLQTVVQPHGKDKYPKELTAIHYAVITAMYNLSRLLLSTTIGATL
jgi:hypothetical protein